MILILFHLLRDQQLITTKLYLFTIGLTLNPSSMNNIELSEFGLSLGNNGSNFLNSCGSVAARAPAVQIQENEVMQVALLSDTVVSALAGTAPGSGHISPDDALELQLFELEQRILRQAPTL